VQPTNNDDGAATNGNNNNKNIDDQPRRQTREVGWLRPASKKPFSICFALGKGDKIDGEVRIL